MICDKQLITRRATLAGASIVAAGISPISVQAQGRFPDRPIKLIIPWAAGGPADGGFRILAESAAKKLGQPVVVENKGGASGVLGALALQDAKPDGYTISQMHMSVLRQPLLNTQLRYDPIKDPHVHPADHRLRHGRRGARRRALADAAGAAGLCQS